MARFTTTSALRENHLRLTIRLIEICLILSTSYGCKLVSVKFTIGIFDENETYRYNDSNFSVALQYQIRKNNEWITEWNTSTVSNYYNKSAETVELNLILPSTSNNPHLQLKWLQNTLSHAPELFINDIIIKGITDDKKNAGNRCKLDKVIDFTNDGLNYLLCNSGAKVNNYGLIFGGQMNKQVTLCTFNLASGKCSNEKDKCMSKSEEVFPVTSINATSSRSITSSSLIEITTVTDFLTTLSSSRSAVNTILSNSVILSTNIPNSTTSTETTMSSNILPLSTTSTDKMATHSNNLMLSSSIKLLSVSSVTLSSATLSMSTSMVAPFSAGVSSMTASSFDMLASPKTKIPVPTSVTLFISKFIQSSATLSLLPASISFNSDIAPSFSSTSSQTPSRLIPTTSACTSILLPPSSSMISSTGSELSVSLFSSKSTELLSTSASISVPTSNKVTVNKVLSSNTIQPTISITVPNTENCIEDTYKNMLGKVQPLYSTRRLFCSNTNSFVTQVCNKSSAVDQPAWHPDLPNSCKNGLLISENLYLTTTTKNVTANGLIQYLINPMKEEILNGDAILLSILLAKLKGCSNNIEEVEALNVLLDSQYISTIEQLDKREQLLFVNNMFIAAEFYGFNCYYQTFSVTTDSISLIVVRINLNRLKTVDSDTIISHSDGSSFVLPKSILVAAQINNHSYFQAVSYRFVGFESFLTGLSSKNDSHFNKLTQYQLGSPVVSLSVSCTSEDCTNAIKEDGVHITIAHNLQINQESDVVCAFWNYSISNKYKPFWSNQGCEVKERTVNLTVCKCDHLTHFGVLFDTTGRSSAKISSENEVALSMITYIGVSLSLMALILTIISMITFRSQWNLRTFVHINLCCTLIVAQLIFILAVDKTSDKVICATIAILLHYFFITSFMWMLMEGVVLYIMLVNVFGFKYIGRRYYIGFALLCYGGPLLYMALCIPLGLAGTNEWSYGSDSFCWLTYKNKFIWAFIAPVILILLINIGFLAVSLKIMKHHLSDKRKNTWYWFRGSISLIVIMGINWIFGLLVFHEYLLPIIYLFAITTTLQGVWIFVFFTFGSSQMREEYSKLLTSLQNTLSRNTINSSSKPTSNLDVVTEKNSHQSQTAK